MQIHAGGRGRSSGNQSTDSDQDSSDGLNIPFVDGVYQQFVREDRIIIPGRPVLWKESHMQLVLWKVTGYFSLPLSAIFTHYFPL